MLEFRHVIKAYGSHQVLKGLSFTAADGRVTGLVGPNGAGKSTSLKVLTGLIRADSGSALIDGVSYREAKDPARSLGIFLGPDFVPGSMTAIAYLEYVAGLQGLSRSSIPGYLEGVGLGHAGNQRISSYSLGMRQRLGLAAAMLGEARNLVLDEPVNGLDIEGVKWVRDYLRTAAGQGRCVLLSSHLLSELEMVADDLVILGNGVAARQGTMTSLTADEERAVVVICDEPAVALAALVAAGAPVVPDPQGIRIPGATISWVASVIGEAGGSLRGIQYATRAIEDVYLQETHRAAGSSAGTSVVPGGVK